MQVLAVIVGFCSLLFVSACTNKTSSYFPLDAGYRWEYKAVLNTMDSTINQKYIIENMPGKKIAGKNVFVQRRLTGSEYIYGQNETGVFQLGYIRGDDSDQLFIEEKRYLFHYPLTPDREWEDILVTFTLKNGGPRGVVIEEEVPVRVKLLAGNEKVRVPAGTFNHCLRIESTGEIKVPLGKYQYIQETTVSVKDTKWYAPGVGLVKSVRIEGTQSRLLDQGKYQMELYSLSRK